MIFNHRLESIQESATLRLNSLAKELALAGKDIVNLTAGELDFETPPEITRQVAGRLELNKYTPSLGLPKLREAIAKNLNRRHHLLLKAENVAVTAGAKQGLFLACQTLLNPGDQVIVPLPGWVSYECQIRLCGAVPKFVPLTEKFDLDISKIKQALTAKTKAIILNSPHNPTGAIFSPAKVRQLLALAAHRKIFIIADEIYGGLVYGQKFTSVLNLKPNFARLILINGFSKSHALTGWRIGYAVAGSRVITACNKILGHTAGNASVISQQAALACLQYPQITLHFVAKLARRRNLAASLLKGIPDLRFTLPKGAFYFFLDIRKFTPNSTQFAESLLKQTGLAVVPGEAFGTPGFLRLSFAASERDIRKGINLLAKFIRDVGEGALLRGTFIKP